jgi:Orn/Lys/Arg decarboxylase, C-terminal domain
VLFMTNIGTTRSSVAYLVEILVKIAQELDERIADMSLTDRTHHERAVLRLTTPVAPLPDFSEFHACFLEKNGPEVQGTSDGDVRRAFYLGHDDTLCEYLTGDEVEEKMESGQQVVSATFVTPYPPGFPVMVPGQVFSRQILSFIRSLDTRETTDIGHISAIACSPTRPWKWRRLPRARGAAWVMPVGSMPESMWALETLRPKRILTKDAVTPPERSASESFEFRCPERAVHQAAARHETLLGKLVERRVHSACSRRGAASLLLSSFSPKFPLVC